MKKHLIYIIALATILTSCSIHKLDIQQGNVLTPEMVRQIRVGMDKKQIVFLLGNPSINDPFHHNRWDYLYTFRSGKTPRLRQRNHVTLYFDGEKLAHFESDLSEAEEDQN